MRSIYRAKSVVYLWNVYINVIERNIAESIVLLFETTSSLISFQNSLSKKLWMQPHYT